MSSRKKPALTKVWAEEQQKALEKGKKHKDKAPSSETETEQAESSHRKYLQGFLWRVAVVLCGALIVLLAGSLFSYTPADAGFTHTGPGIAQNVCGLIGAYVADALFWGFGMSAWWVLIAVVGLFVMSFNRMNPQKRKGGVFWKVTQSFFGLVIVLVCSAGLETLQLGYLSRGLPMGAGGTCGQLIAINVTPYGGVIGSSFVMVLGLAFGASCLLHFSWFSICEHLGFFIEKLSKTLITIPVKPKVQTVVESDAAYDQGTIFETDGLPVAPAAPAKDTAAAGNEISPERVELTAPAPLPARLETTAAAAAVTPSGDGRICPSLEILEMPPSEQRGISKETIELTSRMIESKLKTYRINAVVKGAQAGPVITQYWIELADGVKGSRVEEIRKDLTRALAVHSVRVVPVIPGKPYMGLEIPNNATERMAVYLREIICSETFAQAKSLLTLALGKDIAGRLMTVDLARMPHLLVGGTTGSGKSVAINTMILSLLYKCDPSQLRLVLIDPKTVEFSLYQDIPHLLCPVVTDMNKASNALAWLVQEMDMRYSLMSKLGVRSFDSFNEKVTAAQKAGQPIMNPFDVTPLEPEPHVPLKALPYLVCFIDELADLILVNRKQVEMHIMRLAQKARAAGIHLVLATQRPSVDIVTPLIKANIVARICFQVASRYDSGTVLDENGAEDLLGRGDMLMRMPGSQTLIRIQGCMVDEGEILRVVNNLKAQGAPDYVEGVTEQIQNEAKGEAAGAGRNHENDPFYDAAVQFVLESGRVSTSMLQRKFSIGYNRAANLVEAMESAGLVSQPNAAGKREILVKDRGGL